MTFINSWDNATRADSYAQLEFPNTYFLAYRDLRDIISRHTVGNKALDFGCGTGRSTRFLKSLGYEVVGADISMDMQKKAQLFDPMGKYELVTNGNYDIFPDKSFDVIQSIFTFDNIAGPDTRTEILTALSQKIQDKGKIIMLDSTPEIYFHEWASFTTKDFPENRAAKDGEIVKIVMTDVPDSRPVEDIIWSHEHYMELFTRSGLTLEAQYLPLGREEDGIEWKSETSIAPWVIYVLNKK
jgi:SAM-dependent methyltransferase